MREPPRVPILVAGLIAVVAVAGCNPVSVAKRDPAARAAAPQPTEAPAARTAPPHPYALQPLTLISGPTVPARAKVGDRVSLRFEVANNGRPHPVVVVVYGADGSRLACKGCEPKCKGGYYSWYETKGDGLVLDWAPLQRGQPRSYRLVFRTKKPGRVN